MFRAFTAALALAAVLITAGSSSGATYPGAATTVTPTMTRDAARAEASFDALQRLFAIPNGSGLYRTAYPGGKRAQRVSTEWPFSQVHVAALELTGLPGNAGQAYRRALAKADTAQMRYWSAKAPGGYPGFMSNARPPYDNDGTLFYDDNEWAGLEAIQDYLQNGNQAALAQAEKIFALAVSGWDGDTSHARPGGVFWTRLAGNTARNTVSNMPAAELGLRLYQVTGQQQYLSWATKMYQWTTSSLQSSSGLFYDHIGLKGWVDQSIWSYNQGVPIAVNLLFYQITKNPAYLQEAQRIAAAAYQYFVAGGRLTSQPVIFNSILFKHLLALESQTGGTTYRNAAQSYANTMWNSWRNPKTGVFRLPGQSGTEVLEQAAATQIYAALAWQPSALVNMS